MVFETFEGLKVGIVYPTINGQQPYLSKDVGHVVGINGIGADDFVEFASHAKKSSISCLDELMFTNDGKSKNLSYLMPHEQLRFSTRLEEQEVRAGGVNMKSAALWAPSGKCATTPEEYVKLAEFANSSVTELLSDSRVGGDRPKLNPTFVAFFSSTFVAISKNVFVAFYLYFRSFKK